MHNSTTKDTNTLNKSTLQMNNKDQEVFNFLETLVEAMLGVHIIDIPEDKRMGVVSECVQIFSEYMVNYVHTNFGAKQALRLKAAQQFGDQDIFTKFPEMQSVFSQATLSFLNSLK
jgi:hypothetical protein